MHRGSFPHLPAFSNQAGVMFLAFPQQRIVWLIMKYWCFMRGCARQSESFSYWKASVGRCKDFKSLCWWYNNDLIYRALHNELTHTHTVASYTQLLCLWIWMISLDMLDWLTVMLQLHHTHTFTHTCKQTSQALWLAWPDSDSSFAFPRFQTGADCPGIRYRGIFQHWTHYRNIVSHVQTVMLVCRPLSVLFSSTTHTHTHTYTYTEASLNVLLDFFT